MKTIRAVITLPRIIVALVIMCLLLQIQKGKSGELPKYASPDFVATSIIERVNEHRVSIKVKTLRLDETLNAEAQRYCEMVAKGNLQASLDGSEVLTSGIVSQDVAAWDKTKGVSRNVAAFACEDGSPALSAVRSWIGNAEQVNTIENDNFGSTGIGVVRRGNTYYVCQLFGK